MGSSSSRTVSKQESSSQLASTQSKFQETLGVASCPTISFNATSENCGFFSKLPSELLTEFSKYLSDKDLLIFSSTCKFIHQKISEDSFWLQLISHRNISYFEDDYPRTQFLKIKHWYFFQKNKLSIQIVSPDDVRVTKPEQPRKILLIGSTKTGKSQLMNALCGKPFSEKFITTIGVDFLLSLWLFKGKLHKLHVWDTAGEQRFRSVTNAYYRGTHVVVLVYSVADRQTFTDLDRFFHDAISLTTVCYTIIVVANFQDLDPSQHQVKAEEAREWVNKHNHTEVGGKSISVLFVEVSAKSCIGIRPVRRMILEAYKEEITQEERAIPLD